MSVSNVGPTLLRQCASRASRQCASSPSDNRPGSPVWLVVCAVHVAYVSVSGRDAIGNLLPPILAQSCIREHAGRAVLS